MVFELWVGRCRHQASHNNIGIKVRRLLYVRSSLTLSVERHFGIALVKCDAEKKEIESTRCHGDGFGAKEAELDRHL